MAEDKVPNDWGGFDGRSQWIQGYLSDLRKRLGEIGRTTLTNKYGEAHKLIRLAIEDLEKMDVMVVGLRDKQ